MRRAGALTTWGLYADPEVAAHTVRRERDPVSDAGGSGYQGRWHDGRGQAIGVIVEAVTGSPGAAAGKGGRSRVGDAAALRQSEPLGVADPGQTAFGVGLAGGPGNCLYEYVDGLTAPVLPPSIAAGMASITFTPDGSGGYFWVGF